MQQGRRGFPEKMAQEPLPLRGADDTRSSLLASTARSRGRALHKDSRDGRAKQVRRQQGRAVDLALRKELQHEDERGMQKNDHGKDILMTQLTWGALCSLTPPHGAHGRFSSGE